MSKCPSVTLVAMVMTCVLGLSPRWLPAEEPSAGTVADILGDGGELESASPDAVDEAVQQALDEDAFDTGLDAAVAGAAETTGLGDLATRLKEARATFDRDGDGKLGPEERGDALLQIKNERLVGVERRLSKTADANGDGTLDASEQAALDASLADHQARCDTAKARLLARWDENGDGHLDRTERGELRKAWSEKKAKGKAAAEKKKGDGEAEEGESDDDDDDRSGPGKGKGKAKGHDKHEGKGKGKGKDKDKD